MDEQNAARRWVEGWSRGWQAHDPDVIAGPCTELFLSHPFRAHRGAAGTPELTAAAFADADGAEIGSEEPISAQPPGRRPPPRRRRFTW